MTNQYERFIVDKYTDYPEEYAYHYRMMDQLMEKWVVPAIYIVNNSYKYDSSLRQKKYQRLMRQFHGS